MRDMFEVISANLRVENHPLEVFIRHAITHANVAANMFQQMILSVLLSEHDIMLQAVLYVVWSWSRHLLPSDRFRWRQYAGRLQ